MSSGPVSRAVRGYVAVLRLPGAARPAIGAALAALPIGILGLSVLLAVEQSSARYATAGLVVGLLGLGTGVGMSVQGLLIDRFGQPRVLVPVAIAQLVALVGLVVAIRSSAPTWSLGVLAFAAGAAEPQAGACLRALWTVLVPSSERHVATALSSVLFEAPIIAGPLLLSLVLLAGGPITGVLVAAAFFAGGTLLLATSAASRSWRAEARQGGSLLGALVDPGVRTVGVVGAGQGLLTGLLQVPAAAFAAAAGATAQAPLLFGALSVGSLAGTLGYGARPWTGRPGTRLAVLLTAVAMGTAACAIAPSTGWLALTLFLTGTALGPVVVSYFGMLERLAPPGTLTQAFTMVTAVGLAAYAVGAAVAGSIIDRWDERTAFLVGSISVLMTVVAVITRRPTVD